MRRVATALAAGLCAAALAACGSSGGHSGASAGSPLATALSYFPATTPVIATVRTASGGASASQLKALESSGTSATIIKAGAFQELAALGIDYNRDVKPLLGNPVALGVGSTEIGAGQTMFLAAWQTRSATALARLVASVHALSPAGSYDAAKLYTGQGAAVAVAGGRLLVGANTALLKAALDRHVAHLGFTAADYARDTKGLPSGSALSVVGDLQTALSSPRSTPARRVPWVAALRSYGVTLSGAAHQITARFRIDSSGASLSAAQLPIAAGTQAPGVGGVLPIAFGLRDPAQIYAFVKSTLQAASPAQYAKLLGAEARARRRSGVDVDALARSLTGDLVVTSDGHTTIGRVPVSSADAAQIERVLAHPTAHGHHSVSLGGGLYRLTGSGTGSRPTVAGVVDGQLVAGRASAAEVRGFAGAPLTPVSGTRGALALRIAVGELVQLSGRAQANPSLSRLAAMLGDLTASAQATPQALTGTATLAVR